MKSKIKLFGKANNSIVDGSGFRYTIFTQGCPHNCPSCHNPESHSFDGGIDYTLEQLLEEIKANPMLKGITLSGGEPLAQATNLLPLAKEIIKMGLDIWIYTGYTFEELTQLPKQDPITKLLEISHVLVDGPFILEQKSLELHFKGSHNQRIIDLKQSLKENKAIILNLDI